MDAPDAAAAAQAVVVNDDATQLSVLAGLLRQQGIEPHTFSTAEAALRAMSRTVPDLVVTDLYMPEIDGWQFCRLLRSPEHAALNEVPILVVSATFSGEEADRITADLGANAFLPVPVDSERFAEQVAALLAGESPACHLHVLIVDDAPGVRRLLGKSFAANGYEVDTAATLAAARALLERSRFDLAIIDYHLTDGQGDCLLELLGQRQSHCAAIMMTTDPDPDLALGWMKAGASAYVRKPFTPAYLLELSARASRERALMRVEQLLEQRTRELRESRTRYRQLFEGSRDGFVMTAPDGRITDANQAFCNMLGYSLEQLRALDGFLDLTPERWHEWEMDEIWNGRLLKQGHSGVYEKEYRRRDGSVFPVELRAHTVFRPDGTADYLWAVVRDISASKEAQQALRHSEARFRSLLEDLDNVPIQGYDSERRVIYWNPASTALYGYGRDEALGHRLEDLIIPEAIRQQVVDGIERWLAGGPPVPAGELVLQDRDGNEIPVYSSHVLHVAADGEPELFCVDVDLRDLRQLEEEARRLASAMEQVGEAIVITDAAAVIEYVNPAFEQSTGYDRNEVLGRNANMLKSGAHEAEHYRDLWATIRSGRTWEGRLVNRRKDGSVFTESVTISPVFAAGGTITRYVAVKRDITERLRMEAEKDRIEEQYRQAQKVEAIGRLAGGVAHDLNNLLSPILGYGELLLEDLPAEDRRRRQVNHMVQAAMRARDLVRQLLAFSRKQTLDYRPVDLNDAVGGFRKLLRRTIREDVAIRIDLTEQPTTVLADMGQIEQVIMNLAVNAQDAMPGGGHLALRTGRAAVSNGEDPDIEPGEYVVLTMADSGCGMDTETLAHLFEPFYSTKGEGGTGLGLATVHGIVKQHGGSIRVASTPGEGSTFEVFLPFHHAAVPAANEIGKAATARGGAETILVAEDNDHVRGSTRVMLERQGYTVLTAVDGDQALQLIETHDGPIHLLLTDVIMPGMNGRELYGRIAETWPQIKVLYMSGYPDDVIAERGVLEDGIAFIQKPFGVEGLLNRVREVLDQ